MKNTSIKKKIYVDKETGEEVEAATIIQENENKDSGFDKVWLGHIMTIIEDLGNQKMKVVGWLLNNRDTRNNRIVATQEMIAKGANVSRPTANETIQLMVSSKVLKKERNGVYQLNPDLIFYGGNTKRMNILYEYHQTAEDLQESQEKKKRNSPSKPRKKKKKAIPAG